MAKDKNNWIDDLGKTRTFSPVEDKDAAADADETRTFSLEEPPREPLEKCEERGSLGRLPTSSLIWRIVRPALILLISIGIVVLLGFGIYNYIENNYLSPVAADTSQKVPIEVKSGSSLSSIATLLYENGIIRNKFAFQLYVDINDMSGSLQAGKYELSPGMTMEQIAEILAKGDGGRKTFTITFIEGSTVTDMVDKLVEKGIFDQNERAEFLSLCNDASAFADYDFISELKTTAQLDGRRYLLEGYLFPDTYDFYVDVTPEGVIKKLLGQFSKVFVAEYRERAEELGLTIDEVVTLASMIEWEATEQDFKKVSAVFYNKMDEGQKLGSCATMRYVTGLKKFTYTADELAIDSPYNTYMYEGLPIGPVANPSRKAIDAALYPDETYIEEGYLYFCNKDPNTSELAFAKTLREHEKNMAAFEALQKEQQNETD